MADDWRVSLSLNDRSAARGKTYDPAAVRDLMRSRLGGDITVSADKMHIFLYAGTSDAAEEAERVAREVLAQQSRSADLRLEQWDPSSQSWQDAAGLPAVHEDVPRRKRLLSAISKVTDFIGDPF